MAPTAIFPDNTYHGRVTHQPGRADLCHCLHCRHAWPHHQTTDRQGTEGA